MADKLSPKSVKRYSVDHVTIEWCIPLLMSSPLVGNIEGTASLLKVLYHSGSSLLPASESGLQARCVYQVSSFHLPTANNF
jgi:hypothetical protein